MYVLFSPLVLPAIFLGAKTSRDINPFLLAELEFWEPSAKPGHPKPHHRIVVVASLSINPHVA